MMKTLKNLALALLNATLILIALCLFLAWKVTDKVDDLAGNFAQNLSVVTPLREDIQGVTDELAALRKDLAGLAAQTDTINSAALQRIQGKVEQAEAKLTTAQQSIRNLTQAPTRLIDYAIETAADEFAKRATEIRGCGVPPEA